MKNLILVLSVFLSINLTAQTKFEKPEKFVRVYDMQGKKIGKGKVSAISENSLQLYRHNKTADFPLSNIGFIRTRYSVGNNFLIGALTGAAVFGILGVATADDGFISFTEGEGAAVGGFFGSIFGAGIGGITIIFKRARSYPINADPEKWNAFREAMLN